MEGHSTNGPESNGMKWSKVESTGSKVSDMYTLVDS